MDKPILDDYEKELVWRLAQKYLDHEGDEISVKDFPRFEEVGNERAFAARKRLTDAGLIKDVGSWEIEVLPACAELVYTWDNPPLPDRWDEATKWFRSKWWSLPLLVIAVGLPALKGWVDVIKMLLEWMGITHGSK